MEKTDNYLLQQEVETLTNLSALTINKYLADQAHSRFPNPIVERRNLKLFSRDQILNWIAQDKEKVQLYYRNKTRSANKSRKDYYIMNFINPLINSSTQSV